MVIYAVKCDIPKDEVERGMYENLTFFYDNSNYIFENFNLNIDSNGLYLIKGKNGSGKTTLFNIISGLEEIKKGDLKISIKDGSKNKIIYMPQENEVFNDSILNNITIYNSSLKETAQTYENIFPISKDDKSNFSYSGGEERKISIMRMLSRDSNIYLLDEPFENLGINSKQKLKKILKELSTNAIVLFVSHENYFDDKEISIINID